MKWGWTRGAGVGIVLGAASLLRPGMALAAATITAPDVNQVQAISSGQAVAWIQNVAALAFACGAAATAFFLVRLVLRMYGTDERGTPETMRQMLWFGAGFIVLAGAAFWLGVLKGLAPTA